MKLYLRKAEATDKKIVFRLANDKETRRNSFCVDEIPWEDHTVWYDKLMESEEAMLWLCMDFMKVVGQVRVQKLASDVGEISYSIDADARGLGYGKQMLLLLEDEIRSEQKKLGNDNAYWLVAKVKEENVASCHIFETLGYEKISAGENKADGVAEYRKEILKTKESLEGVTTSGKNKNGEERHIELDILRVLSMGMVVMLHYLSKGNLLQDLSQDTSFSNLAFWLAESACLVCVNVYVLLSGYFMVEKKFRLGKAVGIWCQVLFYSVVVFLVCAFTGVVEWKNYLDFYQLQFFAFPAVNGHYWFATAYLLMYVFSPVLTSAVRNMKKENLRNVILILLICFSLIKSVLPVELPVDDFGNSFVWFLILYLVAAYIRLYGLPFLSEKRQSILCYGLSVAGIFLAFLAYAVFHKQTGAYEYAMTIPAAYNFVFVLTGAVGLFCFFCQSHFPRNRFTLYLARIAPYMFGVYLLHEHLLLRYEWPEWLGVSKEYGGLRILHMLLCVILIMGIGVLVDFLRSLLFMAIEKLMIVCLKLYYSKREVFDYLIFGACTTVFNWIAYIACAYLFLVPLWDAKTTENVMVASVIAWILSVIFAYVTNRMFVFHSTVTEKKAVLKEFFSFVSARIFSFLMELLLMYVMVDRLQINDLISKFVIGFVVIALNYIFSKLWIFKEEKKETA